MQKDIRECCFKTIPHEGRKLVWEITHKCHFNCDYCFQQKKRQQNHFFRVLHQSDLLAICDRFDDLQVKDVLITGGEIYHIKDVLPSICKKLSKNKISYSLSTNYISDEDYITNLIELNPRALNISLDAPINKLSDFNQNQKIYITKLLDKCQERNIEVKITSVFSKLNFNNLKVYKEEINNLLRKYEDIITSVYITNPYEIGYLKTGISNSLEKQKEILKINSESDNKEIKYVNFPRFNNKLQTCFAGSKIVHIEPNGDVYPCHLFANYSPETFLLGNILSEDAKEVSSRLDNFAKQAVEGITHYMKNNEVCQHCNSRLDCGGGCIAEILSQGELIEPQLICKKIPYPKKQELFEPTNQKQIDYEIEKNDLSEYEEKEIIEYIKSNIRRQNHDLAHGFDHTECVVRLATYLAKKENSNLRIVKAAAYFHDFEPRKKLIFESHTKISAQIAVSFLKKLNFSDNELEEIYNCIATSSYGASELGNEPNNIEAKIVRDADWLEAIGARGIARVFAFAPSHNCEVLGEVRWDPSNPIKKRTSLIGPDPTPIYHFFSKLLWIKDKILTKSAKEIADIRHKRLVQFLIDYKSEMSEDSFLN